MHDKADMPGGGHRTPGAGSEGAFERLPESVDMLAVGRPAAGNALPPIWTDGLDDRLAFGSKDHQSYAGRSISRGRLARHLAQCPACPAARVYPPAHIASDTSMMSTDAHRQA